MANDLRTRVAEDVQETGFPLELRVAALLRGDGHPVANNVFFLDRDEGKDREIDLRALINLFFLLQANRDLARREEEGDR